MIGAFRIGLKRYEIRDLTVKDLYYIIEKERFEPIEAVVDVISYLSGCPIEDLKKLKPYQVNPLWGLIMDKLNKKEAPLVTELRLKGTHYGFIHLDELTIGELADLEILKASQDKEYTTHKILSILYRPVTGFYREHYSIEAYDGTRCRLRQDDFLDLDLDVMIGAIFFLETFTQTCISHMTELLVQEGEKQMKKLTRPVTKGLKEWLKSGLKSFT